MAGGRRPHLRDELAGGVEQPHEGAGHGVPDDALHDGLLADLLGGQRGQALGLLRGTTHQEPLPVSIGTPTSEPHSVQLPS